MQNTVYQTDEEFLFKEDGPSTSELWKNVVVSKNDNQTYDVHFEFWDANTATSEFIYFQRYDCKNEAIEVARNIKLGHTRC